MSVDLPAGYRCDLILEPCQYTTVPPPAEEKKRKAPAEVYNPINQSPPSESEIRNALLAWVKTKPLLSRAAAKGMVFTSVSHEVAYWYLLETFTEHRSVCVRFEPHRTAVVPPDGEAQREPRPWRVPVTPAKMFADQVCNFRLIHTDRVSGCPYCLEQGWLLCKRCCGSARVRCPACRGRGWVRGRPCGGCRGERMAPCPACMALGRACCEMCLGEGRLCYYKELRVEYRGHAKGHVHSSGGVPESKLTRAPGEVLHTAVARRVWPLVEFGVAEVNATSRRLVDVSHRQWPERAIVQQRHLLKAVPVTRVQYRWRLTSASFYVYGADGSVYCPEYPQRSTGCCPPWL